MNEGSGPGSCPKCGEAIPSEAPQGLCPKCLLVQASFPTETGGTPDQRPVPPSGEELTTAFPQLEIRELIGQGGMGFVFKARQPKLDRFVALKILPQSLAAEPAFAERFAREGRMLARLNHPNIVTIYDFGQANGFFYLLMEFVDGVNLRQAMKAGRFTPDQALAIVPKICEALQFAHNEGVLHRDIKPENILLDSKGRVKIADFGIAKLIGEQQAASKLTASGGALGTAHYMAPEQVEKPSQVDHRADIYSLGVVFYEMLTGELPIGRFAPPSETCAVDPRIDEVVLRTLEKKPERRPQSAGEVKTQVETIATESAAHLPHRPKGAPQDHAGARASSKPGGRPVWSTLAVAGGAGLALCCIIGLGWLLVRSGKPNTPQQDGPVLLEALGPEVSTNEPFTRTIVFSRATNQPVGESGNTWTVNAWSDTLLQPGEMLSAWVRQDGEPLTENGCLSQYFFASQPNKEGMSVALCWYFGAIYHTNFALPEAEAAAAQVRDQIIGRPLSVTAGKPLMLFSVTNEAGQSLAGYAELTRYSLKRTHLFGRSAPKPQAILHVRRFMAFLPSLDYSVKLPPGYALRVGVNTGYVNTHFVWSPDPQSRLSSRLNDYQSSWLIPHNFHGYQADLAAQMKAQRTLLETRFQELQDMGPIQVVLGKPYPVFSLTNSAGQVFRTWFELVASSATDAPTQTAGLTAPPDSPPPEVRAPLPPPRYLSPQNAQSTPGTNVAPPRTLKLPAKALPPATIDPATGLPAGAGPSAPIDPRTGLPVTSAQTAPVPPRLLTNSAALPGVN